MLTFKDYDSKWTFQILFRIFETPNHTSEKKQAQISCCKQWFTPFILRYIIINFRTISPQVGSLFARVQSVFSYH